MENCTSTWWHYEMLVAKAAAICSITVTELPMIFSDFCHFSIWINCKETKNCIMLASDPNYLHPTEQLISAHAKKERGNVSERVQLTSAWIRKRCYIASPFSPCAFALSWKLAANNSALWWCPSGVWLGIRELAQARVSSTLGSYAFVAAFSRETSCKSKRLQQNEQRKRLSVSRSRKRLALLQMKPR